MATLKKPSKSMSFQNEKSNDFDKAKTALNSGAKIVEDIVKGYAIEYPIPVTIQEEYNDGYIGWGVS